LNRVLAESGYSPDGFHGGSESVSPTAAPEASPGREEPGAAGGFATVALTQNRRVAPHPAVPREIRRQRLNLFLAPRDEAVPVNQRTVNWLYVYVLVFTGLLTAALAWLTLVQTTHNTSLVRAAFLSFDLLNVGLGALTMSVLAWRIWMAVLYRSTPPVTDDFLPRITVVIPAYNEGCQILATVRSVMASTYPARKMKVICVDDGSTDDTYQWMLRARKEFPSRLFLLRQSRNRGKRKALLLGFRHADGKVYVTVDSDSEVLPETLRHLVSPFVHSPRVGAVAGNVRVLNRKEGAIPKMLDVSFTTAFDFLRSGQSVYGGVYCTPGALSAYRVSAIGVHLPDWISQTFMGRRATIGEDRALTNWILRGGYRVVYQREAVVLTKVPTRFASLRRMLLRWARSNVRESLVMAGFMFRRFRRGDKGTGWIRFFGVFQVVRLSIGEMFKLGLLVQLAVQPVVSVQPLLFGCLVATLLPALVYQLRYKSGRGWHWAFPYTLFWLVGLSWISAWGLFSASRSLWLTRQTGYQVRRS
jgi:hyaluronan synthase